MRKRIGRLDAEQRVQFLRLHIRFVRVAVGHDGHFVDERGLDAVVRHLGRTHGKQRPERSVDFRALIARGDEHAVDIQPEALRLRRFRRSGQGLYLYDRRLGRLHVRRLLRQEHQQGQESRGCRRRKRDIETAAVE